MVAGYHGDADRGRRLDLRQCRQGCSREGCASMMLMGGASAATGSQWRDPEVDVAVTVADRERAVRAERERLDAAAVLYQPPGACCWRR